MPPHSPKVSWDAYLRIRFEDLCAEPEPVVRAIHAFLGSLDGDAGWRDEIVPPRSTGRWRREDPELVGQLESIAGPALTRFGYLRDPGGLPVDDHPV